MIDDLLVELVAEHYNVIEILAQDPLIGVPVVPDLRLPQEVEPRSLNHARRRTGVASAEKDRRPEDSFESGHQSAVLPPSLVHAERLEHFGCGLEPNCL